MLKNQTIAYTQTNLTKKMDVAPKNCKTVSFLLQREYTQSQIYVLPTKTACAQNYAA